MGKVNEIKNRIDATLAQIETLAKEARFGKNVDFDKVAREISGHADALKDLDYKLELACAVAS